MFQFKSSLKFLPLCLISQSFVNCSSPPSSSSSSPSSTSSSSTSSSKVLLKPKPTSLSIPLSSSQMDKETYNKMMTITKRLKICFKESELRCKNKDGVQICTLKYQPHGWKGYPLVRVAKTTVELPIEKIVELWYDHNSRKEWDTNFCSNSELIEVIGSKIPIGHITGRSRYYYPPRDYAYHIKEIPSSFLDLSRFNSKAILNIDASDDIPLQNGIVRGNMNSLLYLKAVTPHQTEVTYIVEYSLNGWTTKDLGEFVANNAVDIILKLKKDKEEPQLEPTFEDLLIERSRKDEMRKSRKKYENLKTKADLQKIIDIIEPKLAEIQNLPKKERKGFESLETRLVDDITILKSLQEKAE